MVDPRPARGALMLGRRRKIVLAAAALAASQPTFSRSNG
jgi:hypothetical protein